MESSLLDSTNTDGYKPCVSVKSNIVGDYTEGVTDIKEGMKIPFTCTVYEKVLVAFDHADIAEKNDEED